MREVECFYIKLQHERMNKKNIKKKSSENSKDD